MLEALLSCNGVPILFYKSKKVIIGIIKSARLCANILIGHSV